MPELPEAEHARRLIEAVAVGRRVRAIRCADDPIVYADPGGPQAARSHIAGRELVSAHRVGKYLWVELDRPPHVVSHLGMTGQWRTPGDEPLVLSSSPAEVDRAWPPRFWKIELELDDGGRLAMTNARRLGRVLLRERPTQEPPLSKLGPDVLTSPRSPAELGSLLSRRRRAALKSLLLDQKAFAGVGNWMADEVLYQAGIDPRRRAGDLAPDEIVALGEALRAVVLGAVAGDARREQYPAAWLFHRRWGRAEAVTADGEPIAYVEIGGRTTAWVPSRQR